MAPLAGTWGAHTQVANNSINFASTGRRILVCQRGYICLGRSHTEVGDVVYNGSPIVKDKDQSDTFRFIGEYYIYGIMNGEAFEKHSQDQKMSMSKWLRFKVFRGTGPDLDHGRRFVSLDFSQMRASSRSV